MRFDPYAVSPGEHDGDGPRLRADVRAVLASRASREDVVPQALDLARRWGTRLPGPGCGATRELWEHLAAVAAADLTVARVLEPHLDALAVLGQARADGHPVPAGAGSLTWGIFAAEGPGTRVEAHRDDDGTWRLTGRKPWCSLAGHLDAALVTAWSSPDERRLYAVDLRRPEVTVVDEAGWVARGLSDVASGPVDLHGAVATPVGPAGWYLDRPGFAWGGIGVAACWWGAAAGLAQALADQASRRELDQVGRMHRGAVDALLHSAGATLALAAQAVDDGAAEGPAGAALALRVRRTVRVTAEETLERAARALGPGPLATDDTHARRVADLQLYVRQEHAERDEAALGRLLEDAPALPTAWAPS
ncbi:acyl-CoA dehydrogenase [Ornithinimicrobium sediminis]|uniref:acyl-CoA dehydrogenase n=1 Tax=Ornithinimicrobium sediminis TaxID=2904603 RepID=UPI001E588FC4|nr:acyl-CoA dehydrogenase [Ornithinimicrobium sediminis]MCE0487112.1 acyl-CoA dehydrogenase [Ornithinimicrobium sediminis]